MSFSSVFSINSDLCSFSPDGEYLAYANQNKLIVRLAGNYELFHSFSCVDVIEFIEWSPDSEYILSALFKRASVQVFSVQEPDWQCKLKETEAGIIDAHWSPDSRHIITAADCHVSLSVWSLVGRSVSYIHEPKSTINIALSFSPNGKWFLVVENDGKRDKINIYSATLWQIRSQIFCNDIDNIGGLMWNPNSDIFCIWSGNSPECNVSFYSVIAKEWIALYKPKNFEKPLGIKNVSWSYSGQFLCLGSFDSRVRLLHHITWQSIAEFPHDCILAETYYTVYQETVPKCKPSVMDMSLHSNELPGTKYIFDEIVERPVTISTLRMDRNKPLSNRGIGLSKFSSCGSFLATRDDRMPAAVWIWNIKMLQLASVLVHTNPIQSISWDPVNPRLAITTGADTVNFWCPEGVCCTKVPSSCLAGIALTNALWHPSGTTLALCAKKKMIILKL